MKTIQRLVLTWAIVMVTTIITMPNAYAKEQAAVVIVATGDVYAIDKQQTKRSLQRRSKVFVGDTLATGPKGRAQIRFIDGAVVSLRPDTELNIKKYRYGKSKADEGSIMTLLKGGFRTITGAIGKEKYKMMTPMATIGIRGTHYEAVINNDQLFVALWDGGVTVSNNAGQIDLGLGADYNFGMVQSADIKPTGQIDPPAAIVNDTQPVISPDLSNTSGSEENTVLLAADGPVLINNDEWSSADVILPTTGTAVYSNVVSVSGTGATSNITNFQYNATVDFAAATVQGTMSFSALSNGSVHNWDIAYSGGPATNSGVSGTGYSMVVDSGSSFLDGTESVSGKLNGSFTGKNGNAMEGDFDLKSFNGVTAQGSYKATQ